MPPELAESEQLQVELQQLRDEHALLVELLAVEPPGLRRFMSAAARTLHRVHSLLARRARKPALFRKKISRLRTLYAQLARQAAVLPLPTLGRQLAGTAQALDAVAAAPLATGDALLPVLVLIDAGFLALTTIAERTGTPLSARRGSRLRKRAVPRAPRAPRAARSASGHAVPQLNLALKQLAERLAAEQDKRVDLLTIGLEGLPEEYAGAFFDVLSQLLRNAIEYGIEPPERRAAEGKSARGRLRVEFRPLDPRHSELIFLDDGQGLNCEGIVDAAVASGLIEADATLARDPRQASFLIFHAGLSTAPRTAGRGRGLHIVRDHVKRLDGEIQVATKRGRFTRFSIKLPLPAAGFEAAVQA